MSEQGPRQLSLSLAPDPPDGLAQVRSGCGRPMICGPGKDKNSRLVRHVRSRAYLPWYRKKMVSNSKLRFNWQYNRPHTARSGSWFQEQYSFPGISEDYTKSTCLCCNRSKKKKQSSFGVFRFVGWFSKCAHSIPEKISDRPRWSRSIFENYFKSEKFPKEVERKKFRPHSTKLIDLVRISLIAYKGNPTKSMGLVGWGRKKNRSTSLEKFSDLK